MNARMFFFLAFTVAQSATAVAAATVSTSSSSSSSGRRRGYQLKPSARSSDRESSNKERHLEFDERRQGTRKMFNAFEGDFVEAWTLEEFASVDPEFFEWMNPSEIEAGGTTCGFLHATLGSLPDVEYPVVDVYVCVQFAFNQPAPRGNLAVHCGGPGSLSDCVNNMGSDFSLGLDNRDNYNVIAFDQRGMGRSSPTFVVPECNPLYTRLDDGWNIAFNEDYFFGYDFNLEEDLRIHAGQIKDNAIECWNYPGFQLEVEKADGLTREFHFLEFSGTRQLAEDIERVRQIFGDQPLSVYGVSYGTKVMGLYATIFPDFVNLLVLDGNDDPFSDVVSNAEDIARSQQQRIGYLTSTCEVTNSCPVDNINQCLADLAQLAAIELPGESAFIMQEVVILLYQDFRVAETICEAVAVGDIDTIADVLVQELQLKSIGFVDDFGDVYNTPSKPTCADCDPDYPFTHYGEISGGLTQNMLTSQDYSFGAYTEGEYVTFLMDLNKKYPAFGTQVPVGAAEQWYSYGYFWPSNSPIPPIGNAFLVGVIAGQIYDPYTPYIWTLDMRNQFPYSFLLTSRSVNHGFNSAFDETNLDPGCINNYQKYFATGLIDFTDGTVCDAPDDLCSIESIVSGGTCG